jgi:hypothetical protein
MSKNLTSEKSLDSYTIDNHIYVIVVRSLSTLPKQAYTKYHKIRFLVNSRFFLNFVLPGCPEFSPSTQDIGC